MIQHGSKLHDAMKSDKREKEQIAKNFFEQGYLAQMRGFLDRAIHFYKRSIEFKPSARAHTFLGWVYSIKGLYKEAIAECKKAIKLDPTYGNPYNDIGGYLIELRRHPEAIPWLERALNAPNYQNYCYPHYNLGRIYEWRAQWDKALQHYKLATEEDSTYEPAQTAYDNLRGKYN